MSTSSTSEDTIFPNAAPIITPTAKSTTFPRMANCLNSFSTDILLFCFPWEVDGPWRIINDQKGYLLRGLWLKRRRRKNDHVRTSLGFGVWPSQQNIFLLRAEDQVGGN